MRTARPDQASLKAMAAVMLLVVPAIAASFVSQNLSFQRAWRDADVQPVSAAALQVATPLATECTVEPRTIEDVILMVGIADPSAWDDPYGRSFPVEPAKPRPTGEPAPPEVVAAIGATVNELALCSQGGTLLLQMAFWSDDLIKREFSEPLTSDVIPALQAEPDRGPGETILPDLAVEHVEILEDGRVVADVQSTFPSTSSTELEFVSMVFTKQDDRWLIDDVLEPVSGGGVDTRTPVSGFDQVPGEGSTFVIDPAVASCAVTPRTREELLTLTGGSGSLVALESAPGESPRAESSPLKPSASPSPALQGSPVMPDTFMEIESAVREVVECGLRGSALQRFATSSDGNISRNGISVPRSTVDLAATPPPSHFVFMPKITVEVEAVQLLPDERVAATVSQYLVEGQEPNRRQVIFVRDGSRWVVDETIGLEPFFPSHRVVSGPINVYDRPGDEGTILAVTQPRERLDYRGDLVVLQGDVWIYVRAESGIAGWVRQDEVEPID